MIVDIHAHYGQWLSTSMPDTPERFREVLDRFEIEAAIVSSGRAILYDLSSGNAEVAALITTDPRIYGAIVVNPNHRDESLAELDRYANDQRFVAAKFHPDYARLPLDSPLSLSVLRRIDEVGLPLFVHTWGEAQVEAAASAARAFPKVTFFLFHMGADAWRLAIRRAVEYPNLNLEIVSSISTPGRIGRAVKEVTAERVFFGSDMTLFTPAYAVGLVKGAHLDAEDERKILSLNAKRFFGFA